MAKITRGIKESLKAYPGAILRYWWIIVIGSLGKLADVQDAIRGWYPNMTLPGWLWTATLLVAIFISQFMAWHRMKQDRDRLRKFNVTQDALAKLGKYRGDLISHQNKKIKSETELGQWIEQFNTLKAEISKYICENISPAEAELFDRYGNFSLRLLGTELQVNGSPHPKHIQKQSMLIRDYEWIEELVKDYSRQRGWREDKFLNPALGKEDSK